MGTREAKRYVPNAGLSVPVVTILDRTGEVLEDEQRAVVRWAVQDGHGGNIIFAAGTTGEWDKLDNPRRQQIARVVVDECRRINAAGVAVEAWVGITGHTRAETLETFGEPGVIDKTGPAIAIAFSDQLLHGWDLAQSTGQEAAMPDGLPDAAYQSEK